MIDELKNKVFKAVRVDKVDWLPFSSGTTETRNMDEAEEFYKNSLFLRKAIDKRAEVLSGVDFKVVNEDGEVDEDLQEVLDKPNSLLSGRDLLEVIQKHYDVYGEFYLWVETSNGVRGAGEIEALHVIKPSKITPKIEGGKVQRFEMDKEDKSYQPDEIIWQHRPNPDNYQKAQSLITKASYDTMRAEIELREYQAKVARSGGRFDSILSFDKKLSKPQIKEAKERYKKEKRNAKHSDQGTIPFFAGGNLSVEDLSMSPKELSYIDSKKQLLEEVAALTGVPKSILSTFEGVKYKNAEEARKTFLKETIKPLVDKLKITLTKNLPEGKKVVNDEFIPEDHEEKMSRIQTAADTGSMKINEMREELGLERLDMEAAEQLYIAANKIPIGQNEAAE